MRRGCVLVSEIGRDAPAFGHGQTLLPSPFANARRFTTTAATPPPSGTAGRRRTAAGPASDADVSGQTVPELACMMLAQIDLVGLSVEPELDGLAGRRLVSVDVTNKGYLNPLRHF